MATLQRMEVSVLKEVIECLDFVDASSLGHTSQYFANACAQVYGNNLFQVPPHRGQAPYGPTAVRPIQIVTGHAPTLASVSFSTATSPTASGAEYDSHNSTDTELTTPSEDEWEFEITPEITRRLSLLPARKSGASLPGLPTELQLEIFSYLDKIDSCCLGLTHPTTYSIYRGIFGTKMALSTRRSGPNLLERAWELVGKQECKQCGIYRCELHQHIKTWMPAKYEYCSMKQNFGIPAEDGAKASCYRGKPSKPKRCGRHPERTTSVHQDDSLTMTRLPSV